MKRFYVLLVLLLAPLGRLMAQVPHMFTYQAVVRDSAGHFVSNSTVTVTVSIVRNNVDGTVVYSEVHTATTNAGGLFTIFVGAGRVLGQYPPIDWGNGIYFLVAKIMPHNITTSQRIVSVPYAVYAESSSVAVRALVADSVVGGISEHQSLADVLSINTSANNRQIKNLQDPTDSYDAVTYHLLQQVAVSVALVNHRADSLASITTRLQNDKDSLSHIVDSLKMIVSQGGQSVAVNGCLPGEFSVSATTKVKFSMGNLQYTTTGSHAVATGGTESGTWRFAEHQWDYVGSPAQAGSNSNLNSNGTITGSDNKNISSTYTGWIDLFGWGTGGWNSGATCYQPYSTSTSYSDYYPGGSYSNNLTGGCANADWGVYNAISNGGDAPGLWRTLTYSEWSYLLSTRANADSLYGKATVNGVPGTIFLPDSWTLPAGLSFTPSKRQGISVSYTNNNYTAEQWAKMEAAGAVLLPAAGWRLGSSVNTAYQYGDYWSSTAYNSDYAYGLGFYSGHLNAKGNGRSYGQSVRLVR